MLEQDPNSNLNREIPITPVKPQPKQDYQQLARRMLPDLSISCFKIKQKDYQAVGEIGQLCFDHRARTENGARECLARKVIEAFARSNTQEPLKTDFVDVKSENNNDAAAAKSEPPLG